MEHYYQNNSCTLYQGHALDILKQIKLESIQCIITSPPYWGLRNYETKPIVWEIWKYQIGCQHQWGIEHKKSNRWGGIKTISDKQASNFGAYQTAENNALSQGQFCQKCNAWRGSLGLEPTPELYIKHMVQVFRGVQRVLRKDGSVWLNLGDSYAGSGSPGGDFRDGKGGDEYLRPYNRKGNGLKPKDLCGIPWRVALALQADGWYLRSDIIWHKPNPMPESVTDRPTKAHEYIFLLTKNGKYYYDADAVREPLQESTKIRYQTGWNGNEQRGYIDGKPQNHFSKYIGSDAAKEANGRNKRSVWTIPTQSYPEAHFATFPEKLIEPCLLAGSAIGDIVCDPFSGSGTVLYVAQKFNRKGIGIELSPKYCDLSIKRIKQQTFDFKK